MMLEALFDAAIAFARVRAVCPKLLLDEPSFLQLADELKLYERHAAPRIVVRSESPPLWAVAEPSKESFALRTVQVGDEFVVQTPNGPMRVVNAGPERHRET